jgi:trans-2,3-dihydro-3-hydroxyanthranilate isomerase
LRFYIVDVFAESKYSGNQLAVFRDSGKLTDGEMQRIAQEMHYSETTFITSEEPRGGGYDVRVFTPSFELPFAGHPTLGTAYIIQSRIIGKPTKLVRLNMKVGQIPVSFSFINGRADLLWMRQKEPIFGRRFEAGPISKLLGLRPSDFDTNFPITHVSTGIPFVIVPLKGLKAVRRTRVAQDLLPRFLKSTKSVAILVFSIETYRKENDLNVRVLGAAAEIPEDPATGSANGCLAAYLVKHHYFGTDRVEARVEQGYEIGRKSLILLKAKETTRGIEVNVGGRVRFVASGEFPDKD